MQRAHGTPFNDTAKMLAQALYDAGQTDREIADTCSTSVNNIIWWRKEVGLLEHVSPQARERAAEEAYAPPIRRAPIVARRPSVAPTSARREQAAPAAQQVRIADALSPVEAQMAFAGPVQPDGDNAIEIGTHMDAKVFMDLEELLTTRLLIQGNSGSGKTHLLRRLLEECAGIVQQIIIDPEGDFASFGEAFGHTVIEAKDHTAARLTIFARRARELRGSAVLVLEGLDIDRQMEAVTAFLNALFDAGPEHWNPALVAVDEAHLFAPAQDNGEDKIIRKESQQAMANLMSRGRKRGLAGIIATQRLSKLHKNVAAEASNFLLGRTLLDIDINRAADLLGMSRADSEAIRNLVRGEFLGLGPAIARRSLKVKVGPVMTKGKAGVEKGITPLPTLTAEEMARAMLAEEDDGEASTTVVPFQQRAAR